jgi:hypothetical protein
MSNSNTTSVAATARSILRYAPDSVADIATYGYKGALPPGLNADGEFELRNAIQDEAKRLTA